MKRSVRAGLVLTALAVLLWDPAVAGLPAAPQGLNTERPTAQATQAPARDTGQRRTGTSRIRGRVLAGDNGRPVRRAVVRLGSPDLRESRAQMTDAEGKYEFRDLPAGSYSIYASKSGFISAQFGAAYPGAFGKTVKVEDAETATAGDIVLARACTIAGRVVDETGEPVEGAQVSVLRSRSYGGARRLMPTGGRTTDDLGQFRVPGLDPGSYYICARGADMNSDVETSDRIGYAPTYYPGTPNAGDAQPVEVASGRDATGLEIMLSQVHVARISGIAFDSRGRPPVNGGVSVSPLQSDLRMAGGSAYGRVLPDGTFTANNIPPGDYVLELRMSPPPPPGSTTPPRMEYGRTRVTVAGSDVTGVVIQATTGATLSGQVVFDGASAPPRTTTMSVMASPPPTFGISYSSPTGPPGQVAADGTFTLTGLFGDYLLRLGGAPSGWVVKGVYVNGRDVIDTPMTLEGRDQVTGVQIVLTDRITHLTGTVNDESGQPAENAYVIVVPDDRDKLSSGPGSRYQRSAIARPGTPLKIDGLPAGDYLAVAWKSPPAEFDPYSLEFFDYARKAGTKFSLRDAETKALALRLTDPPAK